MVRICKWVQYTLNREGCQYDKLHGELNSLQGNDVSLSSHLA